jgi:hypothetical protein
LERTGNQLLLVKKSEVGMTTALTGSDSQRSISSDDGKSGVS